MMPPAEMPYHVSIEAMRAAIWALNPGRTRTTSAANTPKSAKIRRWCAIASHRSSILFYSELLCEESERERLISHGLRERLTVSVAAGPMGDDEDRIGRRVCGLQRRTELPRLPRRNARIVLARNQQHRGIVRAFAHVVIRRVGVERIELFAV